MKYNNTLALVRTGLTMLITETIKAAGGHISTYYKSEGIPYKKVLTEDIYDIPVIITINQFSFYGAESVILMHLSVRKDNLLRIIYKNIGGNDCNTVADEISIESLYTIVKWLQYKQLLLAPRKVQTCYHCGSFDIKKGADVNVNDDNSFHSYHDPMGSEENWCPDCQHIYIDFVDYDQTDIPDQLLNKWWNKLSCEIRKAISDNMLPPVFDEDESVIKCIDAYWMTLGIDIKRRIWCNYREI